MPRAIKKENLPTKICVSCQRPFSWRKKWERCWEEVTTCSKSCNSKRRANQRALVTITTDTLVAEERLKHISGYGERLEEQMSTTIETSENEDDGGIGIKKYNSDEDGVERDEKYKQSNDDLDLKELNKARKKELKAERRAKRMGSEDSVKSKQKPCDKCSKNVHLLIRCQLDETKQWRMVCGNCWHDVSGGQVDGDSLHPFYKYGGLWKNRAATK